MDLLTVAVGVYLTLLLFLGPFSSDWVGPPALIGGFVPGPIVTFYVIIS